MKSSDAIFEIPFGSRTIAAGFVRSAAEVAQWANGVRKELSPTRE